MVKTLKQYVKNAKYIPKYFKSTIGVNRLLQHFRKTVPILPPPVYPRWIEKNENFSRDEQIEEIKSFKEKPLISILMPVYNVKIKYLKKAIESVENQTYTNWQLCIADDCSTDKKLKEYLETLKDHPKIDVVFRKENGNISEATNTAFDLAKGEFIALLDNDDEIAPNALFEVVKYINEHPDVDMIYSDEDKMDQHGNRRDPYFKPDFSPDTLMSNNYICHFLVFRRSLVEQPLMNKKYDGAQDYDLILRLSEKSRHIGHIPKMLYHWRMIPTSTAADADNKEYIMDAGQLVLEDTLKRRGLKGIVKLSDVGGYYHVKYGVKNKTKVSIIIPTKDNPGDVEKCVQSIIEKTWYPDYEIIIINNNSEKEETFRLFEKLEKEVENLTVYDLPIPFNYSRINNFAAKKAKGDYLLFLNDDTEVLTYGWMAEMVGFAQQEWVGAVGAKLFYPDMTIQHAGVVVGFLGIAGHVYTKFPSNEHGYFGRLKHNVNYTAVTGACLMVKAEKFWQVGGFDENIAVAFNDVDLCCKLTSAGYYNVFCSNVHLIHYESKSRGYETTADKILRFEKEKGRIRMKWRELIDRDPMYNPNLTLLRGDYSLDV